MILSDHFSKTIVRKTKSVTNALAAVSQSIPIAIESDSGFAKMTERDRDMAVSGDVQSETDRASRKKKKRRPRSSRRMDNIIEESPRESNSFMPRKPVLSPPLPMARSPFSPFKPSSYATIYQPTFALSSSESEEEEDDDDEVKNEEGCKGSGALLRSSGDYDNIEKGKIESEDELIFNADEDSPQRRSVELPPRKNSRKGQALPSPSRTSIEKDPGNDRWAAEAEVSPGGDGSSAPPSPAIGPSTTGDAANAPGHLAVYDVITLDDARKVIDPVFTSTAENLSMRIAQPHEPQTDDGWKW
tara:strand:- start:1751 stop:2653 length:903 start_codon:yes stop_codon:yes gene_type:complete